MDKNERIAYAQEIARSQPQPFRFSDDAEAAVLFAPENDEQRRENGNFDAIVAVYTPPTGEVWLYGEILAGEVSRRQFLGKFASPALY